MGRFEKIDHVDWAARRITIYLDRWFCNDGVSLLMARVTKQLTVASTINGRAHDRRKAHHHRNDEQPQRTFQSFLAHDAVMTARCRFHASARSCKKGRESSGVVVVVYKTKIVAIETSIWGLAADPDRNQQ